ncbi:DUF2079 domain-containing protein [Rhodococcus sp. BP-349]|uniref:DUF2079 domain-containing protein n=1 Tax=unclassified Rhodococcus (in: high G+C Gram-positive bacteria) TaxID=192944 RepID=UPI001C9B4988|nr:MULTISPECIES: DUF2079 domain-containing protein [unclassified Rhodococcus (in: high G+C Gram-positive bacteria)]MBY6540160.1 DUF2079 domain-containing protein [Rhodococcus sp. BP-363]MBY6543512.1 DUF2079 domain-containing protein [Rhodococcus sp. BP-369]MBY6562742.1 DUF2079 domain-containing protein [Rhodococcus sp. BP-370]MBY6577034.1 DUF2079 domain-containing protein [Rhodococcus sp. BP-364]MBY6586335.1 DUF2079 domain-containing protein [Rhodococcus sp. BP-358]
MTATRPPAETAAAAPSGGARRPQELLRRARRADIAVPAIAFLLLAPLYSALSVVGQHQLRTSGFDLGIFVQQIASYARLDAPTSDLLGTGYNTLGDHFSPITALLAPFYRLAPVPETLLIAQGVLFAVGVVPLSRWACRSLGTVAGIVVALGYGLSWGLQSALNFDFHEIAFGVPMLAFAMAALGQGHWRAAVAWTLPLVFVKEDMGLTVIVIGALIAWWTTGRTRILGLATAAWGAAWIVLAITVVIPLLSADDAYGQGSKLPPLGEGIADTTHGLVSGDSRAATVLLLLAVTGFAALRSPLTLVAVPTVAWRFLSDNTNFWKPIFHYNAILMPILFAALIDALIRGRRDMHLSPRAQRVVLAAVTAVALIALPFQPLARLADADGWRVDPQVTTARAVSASIPPGDRVSASNNLVPQFVSDHPVSVFPQRETDSTTPDWIVVNIGRPAGWPKDESGDNTAISAALADGYSVVSDVNGILVLRR